MAERALCKSCGVEPKALPRHFCPECLLRRQTMDRQIEAARQRAAAVPGEMHRGTVPLAAWPPGRRWCSGCQSFRLLADVASGRSQCRPCESAKAHDRMLMDKYGIDRAEYERILVDVQGGRCAICGGRPSSTGTRFALDHDHKTGAVRGILCSRCNHELLGAAHDSLPILLRAANYLRTPPAQGDWPGLDAIDV